MLYNRRGVDKLKFHVVVMRNIKTGKMIKTSLEHKLYPTCPLMS